MEGLIFFAASIIFIANIIKKLKKNTPSLKDKFEEFLSVMKEGGEEADRTDDQADAEVEKYNTGSEIDLEEYLELNEY